MYLISDNRLFISDDVTPIIHANDISIDEEYLKKGDFIICSTCTGFGDWAILSAMPRLLKKKYPNCKVYIPTSKWLMDVMGFTVNTHNLFYRWDDKYDNLFSMSEIVFKNNPYIDGFKDDIPGIVYTDHFRHIKDTETKVPLAKQLLRFYKFEEDEIDHVMPEIYFSDEEIESWMSIFVPDGPYGCLTISNRSWGPEGTPERIKAIKEILDFYKLPIIYFGDKRIEDSSFSEYSKSTVHMIDITTDIRFQTFIRMNARYNVGSQTGVLEVLAQYTETFMSVGDGEDFRTYFINGIRYI